MKKLLVYLTGSWRVVLLLKFWDRALGWSNFGSLCLKVSWSFLGLGLINGAVLSSGCPAT